MIYIVIGVLALLLAANHVVSRSLLYPPSLYTAVWLVSLFGLVVSGDTFFPVSTESLMVYLIGAVSFSVGGLGVSGVVAGAGLTLCGAERVMRTRLILDVALLFVLIGLPFYLHSLLATVDIFNANVMFELRRSALESAEASERSFSLVRNLVVLSQFVAMAMYYENDGSLSRSLRSYTSVALALVYAAFTGSKGSMIGFILSLAFISFIRARKIRGVTLAWAAVSVLFFFSVGLIMINYAGMDAAMSRETMRLLGETVQSYWLGGLVAFNQVVQAPESLESTQQLNRFFLETWNSLGGRSEVPSINAGYTWISPLQETNTYTIYFSYFKDHGWAGVSLGMMAVGALLTWIYKRALFGGAAWVALYGVTSKGVVLSFHAEHFVLGLNFYLKMLIFFYLVYDIFPRIALHREVRREARGDGA